MRQFAFLLAAVVLIAACSPATAAAPAPASASPGFTVVPVVTVIKETVEVTSIVEVTRIVIVTPTYTPEPLYTPTKTPVPSSTPVPSKTPRPSPTVPPLARPKGNGFYLVSTDIEPGIWRSQGSGDSCYWEITDNSGNIISNHFGLSGGTMRVRPTDFQVLLEDCGTWTWMGP